MQFSGANKASLFLVALSLLLNSCDNSNSKSSRRNIDDTRSSKIARLDAVNLKNLYTALNDSVEIDNFALIQFLHDTLPRDLFRLTRLRKLTISFTYVEEMPIEICKLRSLHHLALNKNKLSDVNSIVCLTDLVHLELRSNGLEKLPENFHLLRSLKYLNLADNDFSSGLSSLPGTLQEIDLSNCNLRYFPEQLLVLLDIESISLRGNPEVKSIPEQIQKLNKLRELILVGCNVGDAQVAKLREQLPNCQIFY